MSIHYTFSAAYRLDWLVYRGPGPGLPAADDNSTLADLIRRTYAYFEISLARARGISCRRACDFENRGCVAEKLKAQIEESDLAWPLKDDFRKLFHAEEALSQQLRGAA
jgi:hypothetical protein